MKDVFMYNRNMSKQRTRKRSSMIFLILGMMFLGVGLATDQTAFTWAAVAFVLLSLFLGGRWLRPKNK
jgi:hypothetical protein